MLTDQSQKSDLAATVVPEKDALTAVAETAGCLIERGLK